MTEPDPPLQPGHVLSDRYQIREEIGRGGAGRVFRAHDERLDRPVAVKVLTDFGEAAVARFRREAATAARIRHPNVVTLHDAGIDGAPFLVMSLVDGVSLADRVQDDGPLGREDLHRLASDLFAGVDATHEAGVLHRDLTPRNVLFDHDGTALLADFGIARGPDDPTITAEHTIMGTRPFVAPERLRGEPATVAADVYAVGVTLRYAATGTHASPMPPDHPFAALVEACTSEDPAGRPTSAAAAGRHLETLAPDADRAIPPTQALPPATATTVIERPPPTRRHTHAATAPPSRAEPAPSDRRPGMGRPVLVLGALAALAVAAMIGSAAMRNDTPQTPAPADQTTTPAESAPADPAPSDAPAFDPGAPGDSARRLAEWLRSRDG